ncbi:MFS transporter [Paraburkholderia sp. BL25I1N1]|uniref:MFS transporter n=1 Tax=Paraburkholderia sp. BL25I1N1 TaxID=1938804 RepID=UPI000D05F73D|nr:MFS transporter [Paraburkholderia sp. BL25I1N1]PRY04426.1 D-galactonate transporter [Paraburkholderia sp. BL25I1N1]
MHSISIDSTESSLLDCSGEERDAAYRKVVWRLMPFLFACYFVNYLDRANIGFAKLQFTADLHFGDAVYGFGAGLFFVGYVIFEVPSNLLLQRIGTRATITRIMIFWGLVSAATAFVRTPTELYVARFFLGVAEAGFFPGVVLYLTYWFPSKRRGRMTSVFMSALAVAGIFGSPLSGLVMTQLHGLRGLAGWQVLFIVEGLPAAVLGVIAWFLLEDGPERVSWLTPRQKEIIARDLAVDRSMRPSVRESYLHTLLDIRVYVAGFVSATMFSASVSIALWAPTLIREAGARDFQAVGLLTAIPYLAAAMGMYFLSRSSDLLLERRWHAAAAAAACGVCLAALPFGGGSVLITVALLSVAAAGLYGAIVVFWTIPPAYLPEATRACGIALISSLAAISGFFSPAMVGALKAASGSLYIGLAGVGAVTILGALVLLIGIPADSIRPTFPR